MPAERAQKRPLSTRAEAQRTGRKTLILSARIAMGAAIANAAT